MGANNKSKPLPKFQPVQIQAFWLKVERGNPDECWLWKGEPGAKCYGNWAPFGRYGRRFKANRIAWFLSTGHDPLYLYVCHTCDNPRCVNPSHLFAGTGTDNQLDAVRKGRHAGPSQGLLDHARRRGQRKRCKRGHLYTAETTAVHVKPNGNKYRSCKLCQRIRNATALEALKQKQT